MQHYYSLEIISILRIEPIDSVRLSSDRARKLILIDEAPVRWLDKHVQ